MAPRLAAALLLLLALRGWAQDGPGADAQSREFRRRVAELALIYGDSSGLDPAGRRVEARRVGEAEGGCAQIEVLVREAGEPDRRERLRACRHGAGAAP
jgi:hypothetical protein